MAALTILSAGCRQASPTAPSPAGPPSRFALSGHVLAEDEAVPASTVAIVSGPGAGRSTTTDASGQYRFDELDGGQITLRATADGFQASSTTLTLDADRVADIVLGTWPATGLTLSGIIESAGGPIAQALITVVEGAAADTGRKTTSDVDGAYRIAGLTPGALTLEVTAAAFANASVSLTLESDTIRNVELTPVAAPTVMVTGMVMAAEAMSAPRPIAGAQVSITTGASVGRTATTDASGQYTLTHVQAGLATITARATGYDPQSQTVTIATTDRTLDFTLTALPPAFTTAVEVVDVLTGAGLAGISASGSGISGGPSDATGALQAGAADDAGSSRRVTFAGPDVVTRETLLRVPGATATVSLIPARFNLAAFDEMFRDPGLRRWTEAPPLVIERRAVVFTDVDMTGGDVTADVMSDIELDDLVADFRWALPTLTADTYPDFSAVASRTTPEGDRASLVEMGVITVTRVVGLADATGAYGWSRWLYEASGRIIGGTIMLDMEFDQDPSAQRRPLRAHELGHALGYGHVYATASIMNPAADLDPTPFDLDAVRIAFERQPGNRTPDVDPNADPHVQRTGAARWSPPIP